MSDRAEEPVVRSAFARATRRIGLRFSPAARLLAPTVLILLALSLYPFLYNLYLSFFETPVTGGRTFTGFGNFTRLVNDWRFWAALRHTFAFTIATVVISVVGGLALAAALDKVRGHARRVLLPIVVIPMAISPLVVGLIFKFLYNDAVGPINYYLEKLGLHFDNSFLGSGKTAIWAVALVDIWQWTPFAVLVFLAALQSLPPGPIEASRIDGASAWDTFLRVKLPLIRTEVIVVVLLRVLDSLKVFDIVFAMTRGGPGTSTETLSMYLQKTAFTFVDFGYAAAMSIVLLFMAIALTTPLARRLHVGAWR